MLDDHGNNCKVKDLKSLIRQLAKILGIATSRDPFALRYLGEQLAEDRTILIKWSRVSKSFVLASITCICLGYQLFCLLWGNSRVVRTS